ncbi:response regulator transcription factor [uncultured Clostridium sp.]|uniref:response regulator transcription factor n=1 Tax=uncultured Clostridium sp. TaxID=59620 RepID=UPI0025F025D2|nr:response regulator transcription factor [uncultured Clostridium sp.]MDU4882333.1 response regulator transcription factor [Clostridium celatum]MDU7075603.1 response regulator transcription factor [Clostridium celatum]
MRILIAEDEDDIRRLLALNMKKEGYDVIECKDGIEALEAFKKQEIHLALLDIMMPNIDGITVMEEIRKLSIIPIIFITAMSRDTDKVLALGLGADDYIVKPINAIELTARVSAQLRRCYKYIKNKEESIEIKLGELRLNKEKFEVYKNELKIDLNPKEFKILDLLMSNPGRVYTKKQIYEKVWDEQYFGDDNTLLVHLSHLREKIEENPKTPKYLKTIRGIGYKVEVVN